MILSLHQANRIITEALDHADAQGLKPLTVAVLDAGGHLVALQRQDGSSTLRPAIAIAKAASALALGQSSRRIAEIAAERPAFIASLGAIAPHGIVPAPGGLLLLSADAITIGAIGISGDTPDNDEKAALAGIASTGLLGGG